MGRQRAPAAECARARLHAGRRRVRRRTRARRCAPGGNRARPRRGRRPGATATLPLQAIEREHIVKTLDEVRGNKAVAARLLGISRRAFYRQLERHGLHHRIPSGPRTALAMTRWSRRHERGSHRVTRRSRVLVADDTESVRSLFERCCSAGRPRRRQRARRARRARRRPA